MGSGSASAYVGYVGGAVAGAAAGFSPGSVSFDPETGMLTANPGSIYCSCAADSLATGNRYGTVPLVGVYLLK